MDERKKETRRRKSEEDRGDIEELCAEGGSISSRSLSPSSPNTQINLNVNLPHRTPYSDKIFAGSHDAVSSPKVRPFAEELMTTSQLEESSSGQRPTGFQVQINLPEDRTTGGPITSPGDVRSTTPRFVKSGAQESKGEGYPSGPQVLSLSRSAVLDVNVNFPQPPARPSSRSSFSSNGDLDRRKQQILRSHQSPPASPLRALFHPPTAPLHTFSPSDDAAAMDPGVALPEEVEEKLRRVSERLQQRRIKY